MKAQTYRLSLCLALALACLAAVSGQDKPYPVRTEIKDGIKTIMNPEFPRDGRFVAKLTEEMSWGEEGGPDDAILNKPLEIAVDNRGRLYVMDWGDITVKVYDEQGKFLGAVGREGQGPGEFMPGARLALLSGDRICILDGRQSRVTILTTKGQYLSSFPLKGFHRDIAVDGQDRIYLARWGAAKEPGQLSTEFQEIPYVTSIFLTDTMGKELVHLLDLHGESVSMKASGGSGGAVSTMVGGGFEVVWNVDAEGRIYGGCNENLMLSVFGPDGKIAYAFGRDFTPLKNPRIKGIPGQKKNWAAFSPTIAFDDAGNVWIELSRPEKMKELTYDVFSPDGTYLKQVRIGQRISRFWKGKIYSLLRPEEGFPSVKRYRFELVADRE